MGQALFGDLCRAGELSGAGEGRGEFRCIARRFFEAVTSAGRVSSNLDGHRRDMAEFALGGRDCRRTAVGVGAGGDRVMRHDLRSAPGARVIGNGLMQDGAQCRREPFVRDVGVQIVGEVQRVAGTGAHHTGVDAGLGGTDEADRGRTVEGGDLGERGRTAPYGELLGQFAGRGSSSAR